MLAAARVDLNPKRRQAHYARHLSATLENIAEMKKRFQRHCRNYEVMGFTLMPSCFTVNPSTNRERHGTNGNLDSTMCQSDLMRAQGSTGHQFGHSLNRKKSSFQPNSYILALRLVGIGIAIISIAARMVTRLATLWRKRFCKGCSNWSSETLWPYGGTTG